MHEIKDGMYGDVGGMLCVNVPGSNKAEVVPSHIKVTREKDGTMTLHGPLYVFVGGVLHSAFLIHDEWFVQPTARRLVA